MKQICVEKYVLKNMLSENMLSEIFGKNEKPGGEGMISPCYINMFCFVSLFYIFPGFFVSLYCNDHLPCLLYKNQTCPIVVSSYCYLDHHGTSY